MRNTFLIALSLLTAGTGVMAFASEGKPATVGYAIAFNPTALGSAMFGFLDIKTGTFRAISELPDGGQGLARDNGEILTVDSSNNLVRINPGNGKTTLIGPTGITTPGPVGGTLVDVIASLETGEVFLMDYSNNLYSVDRKTGRATFIGSTGIPAIISPLYASSFAGDCTSLFFTIDEVDENGNPLIPPTLYRIDPHTGAATAVGPVAPIMPGSGFIGGTLYGFSLDTRLLGGTEPPHVFAIDTSTGVSTRISDLKVPAIGGAVRLNAGHDCRKR
jgi:outer membrane protein assembly factor BamB